MAHYLRQLGAEFRAGVNSLGVALVSMGLIGCGSSSEGPGSSSGGAGGFSDVDASSFDVATDRSASGGASGSSGGGAGGSGGAGGASSGNAGASNDAGGRDVNANDAGGDVNASDAGGRDVNVSDTINDAGGRDAGVGDGAGPGATPQVAFPPLPTVESETFSPSSSTTDIADDSAIYANPTAPEQSVVIADNKDDTTGGVGVFDMQGKLLQFRQDGKIGNVDLRPDFSLQGQSIVLVGANNRTNDSLIFWQLDPATRQLSAPIGASIPTTSPNYGFCLYHSATSGKFYAFVTQETGTSIMEQYELGENAGKITGTKVRSFEVGSITEGCVADDELGRLYVAQEDVALWRYGAEPSAGSDRTQVGAVGDLHLAADLEGVSLAKGPGTSGYLVLSIQGESRFVMYDRETNAFLRDFTVGASGTIDATGQTDGLDISTSNLGPGFPKGALVVHDGTNTGGAASNLKYVPLQ